MGIYMKGVQKGRFDDDYLRGVFLLKNLIAEQDHYTYVHSINVSKYATLMGQQLNLNCEDIRQLTLAGLLHDIGKAKLPKEVLLKRGKLSEDEFSLIKTHPQLGADIIGSSFGDLQRLQEVILYHHEWSAEILKCERYFQTSLSPIKDNEQRISAYVAVS